MKILKSIVLMLIISVAFGAAAIALSPVVKNDDAQIPWKNGDIVFQYGTSESSKAIMLATGSRFSHCGIVFEQDGKWMVLEAVQPVRVIPVDQWIRNGSESYYEVRRLKDRSVLTDDALHLMRTLGASYVNKNYDLQFEWTDDRMYCSELVWKIYDRGAGVKLSELKPLKEYDIDHATVRKHLELRYGRTIPLDEKMVSPQDIYESSFLE